MHQYVVFLRGINVGGHTVIKTTLLKAFESLGFQNVSTYKQSGNVIFYAASADPEAVTAKVEAKLREVLGYEVATSVCTIAQLKQILDVSAFKGCETIDASFLVTFLSSTPSEAPLELPLTIPKSTAQIIASKGMVVFSVTHGGGEGGMPNPFLESKLKVKATTRNLNIIREIVERYSMKE